MSVKTLVRRLLIRITGKDFPRQQARLTVPHVYWSHVLLVMPPPSPLHGHLIASHSLSLASRPQSLSPAVPQPSALSQLYHTYSWTTPRAPCVWSSPVGQHGVYLRYAVEMPLSREAAACVVCSCACHPVRSLSPL
eukprot:6357210-Prymnesium_polylepis.1